jgi:hypothetical protein
MNRLGFLKRLGALAVAAVVAEPILEALAAPHTITTGEFIIFKVDGYTIHWKYLPIFDKPLGIRVCLNEPLESYRMIFPDSTNEQIILP